MATTTYRELRNAIVYWCSTTTARLTILSNSGELPQPSIPYASVFLNADNFLGYPKQQLSEDGLTYTVTRTVSVRVQIDIYGSEDKDTTAMQDASLLQNALYNPVLFQDSSGNPQKNLWEICGLLNVESATDLSALETGIISQRAQLVFNVVAELSNSFTSDYYNKVQVDVRRSDPDIDVTTFIANPNATPPDCQ